ncbi:MAG: AgmX/PglI C-terminal domain-containing protein [Polyangia bacterium]
MLLAACSGGGDDQQKAKLATDLVQCRNDLTNLKEQLAESKAQLEKAKEAKTCLLEPIDLKAANAGQKHMEGNIAPDAVIKVVKQNSGGLRACYEKALKRKPDLQYVSAVTAKFEVANTGAAQGVTFAPHTDPEMERCMASTMEKWKFPTFQGDPVAFEQPVNLVAK